MVETEHFDDEDLQPFFREICDLIDELAETTEEKVELIEVIDEFQEDWLDTYGVTGLLWMMPKTEDSDERKNVKVSEETHSDLLRIQGFMQSKTGKTVTMDEVVEETAKSYEAMHSNEMPTPDWE